MTTAAGGVTIAGHRQQFAVPEVRRLPQTGSRGLAIIAAAVIAMVVDGTAANLVSSGLPYLQGRSAATPDEGSWILTAFNAPYYATILFSPWLYARLGRRRLLLTGLIGFAMLSLLLADVQPLTWVIVLRFLQGIALGCVFVPAALLLLTSLPLNLLGYVPVLFSTVVLGAGLSGSIIGGYLSETYGAGVLYLPSAIAALAAAWIAYAVAPVLDAPKKELRPNVTGYALALLAFGALQYLANEGERRNWLEDSSVIVAAIVLAIAAPALAFWEMYVTERPVVNFRLLAQRRNLAVGTLMNLVLGMVGYSVITFILYLQTIISDTATQAGAMILLRLGPYVIGIALAFILVSRKILGIRTVICIAAIGSSLAFAGFGHLMTTTAYTASFIAISLVFGLFFSMLSQPVPVLVFGSLGLTDIPAGLALYKLSAPIGLSIGTGIFQTFLDHRSIMLSTRLAASVTHASVPVEQYLRTGGHVYALVELVQQQARAFAFQDSMIVYAVLVLLAIPIAFLADVHPKPSGP